MKPVDVLIVGGGPAGLAAAIAASAKGLRVAVIDHRSPPIDKTCGEGLLPSAIAALRELSVPIDSRLGISFTSIAFADENWYACAPISGGCGIGVRRRELHRLLVEKAEQDRVSLRWGTRISGIEADGVWTEGEFRRCRWLVGADGQHSVVRRFAGLDRARRSNTRFGFRQHFAIRPWSAAVEVYWGKGVQLIVTPTAPEETCAVVLTSDPRVRIERAIAQFPQVARRLDGAPELSRETGVTTRLSRARAVIRANVALVGDASCVMDGISGSGLGLAFQQALALAEALSRENLPEYATAHARITRIPVRMTQLLLSMGASARLRRFALRVLSRNPSLFAQLISWHAGGAPASTAVGEGVVREQVDTRVGCHLYEPS